MSHPAITGWCPSCQKPHRLEPGEAPRYARELMARLEAEGRIDFVIPAAEADPRFRTDVLFGPARGQMFGVLTARSAKGKEVVLRAFSGQFNGLWEAPGWVGPLFSVPDFAAIMAPGDARIKALSAELEGLASGDPRRADLRARRKALSRGIQRQLHDLYVLPNFRGATAPLAPFYKGVLGPPTGAGDCCAPKLLHAAARLGLQPTGLAEFYFGADNPSGRRTHGVFYAPCEDKCAPILGWMLCGAGS